MPGLSTTARNRALIRTWFRQYLHRGFVSGPHGDGEAELNMHLLVLVRDGEDAALAGILDSMEGKAWLDRERALLDPR